MEFDYLIRLERNRIKNGNPNKSIDQNYLTYEAKMG